LSDAITNSPWGFLLDDYQMKDLIAFDFSGASVRIVMGKNGEPWFCGKDVCAVLGYTNPTKAMADHCKGVTISYPLQTPGGMQDLRFLTEPDTLRLIIKSNLPAAVKFEAWVFEELLPSIRKTGTYQLPVQPARLLDTREKYDVVKDVMETAKLDEDALTVSMCRDSLRNTILPEINGQQPKALTGPKPFQTHEVLEGLGLNRRQLRSTVSMAGRILAIAYRKEFELEPETVLRFIDGTERKVKCYPPEWKGHAEEILKTWLKTNNVVMLPGADQ